MAFFDDIDDSAEGVEDRMASGGLLSPGFYRATLTGAKETESKSKGTPGFELTFTIADGIFAGKEVTDTLWKTEHQFSIDRIKLAMVRLGLRKYSPDGKKTVPVEGKTDFMDCLDAPIVIEVVHEQDKQDANKKWVRVAPNGFHDPNSGKIKDILARGGKPIGKGKEAGQGKGSDSQPAGDKPAEKPAPAATQTPAQKRRDISKL